MTAVAHVLGAVFALYGIAWLTIYGGIGALLAHGRGRHPSNGLKLGLLGPLGWIILWHQTPSGPGIGGSPLDDPWSSV